MEPSNQFFSKEKYFPHFWKLFRILTHRFTKIFSFAVGLKSKLCTDPFKIKS